MTTREEYTEAAAACEGIIGQPYLGKLMEKDMTLAARVLRQLAEGAVLCHGEAAYIAEGVLHYRRIEEQP
jgi:hypothetical protein